MVKELKFFIFVSLKKKKKKNIRKETKIEKFQKHN